MRDYKLSECSIILLTELEKGDASPTELMKKTNITYSHISKISKELFIMGLVRINRISNRTYNLILSEKGKSIINHYNQIDILLKDNIKTKKHKKKNKTKVKK